MFRLTAILWLCNHPENIYMSPLRYRRTVTSAWSFTDLILKLNLYVPINQKQSRTQYWPLGNTPLYLFCDYAPLHSYWLLEAEKDDKMKRRVNTRVNRSKKLYNMLFHTITPEERYWERCHWLDRGRTVYTNLLVVEVFQKVYLSVQ